MPRTGNCPGPCGSGVSGRATRASCRAHAATPRPDAVSGLSLAPEASLPAAIDDAGLVLEDAIHAQVHARELGVQGPLHQGHVRERVPLTILAPHDEHAHRRVALRGCVLRRLRLRGRLAPTQHAQPDRANTAPLTVQVQTVRVDLPSAPGTDALVDVQALRGGLVHVVQHRGRALAQRREQLRAPLLTRRVVRLDTNRSRSRRGCGSSRRARRGRTR